MPTPKKLERFLAVPDGDRTRLTFEVEGGEVIEIEASLDQLDMMADTIDDILLSEED
jgi:phosphoribosyl 1,2-cyclic phosphodiesterase